jgi:uncharacterized membrane protein
MKNLVPNFVKIFQFGHSYFMQTDNHTNYLNIIIFILMLITVLLWLFLGMELFILYKFVLSINFGNF